MDIAMKIIVLVLLFSQKCIAFNIPRDECKSDLSIDKKNYNATATYEMGDAEPAEAHYDPYGNLFFVEFGSNFDGYYFDIKLIKPNSTTAESIPGLPERESYSIAVDKKDAKVYFGTGKGIYAYNYETRHATLISKTDIRLNDLLVDKDGNKYITGNQFDGDGSEKLFLLRGHQKIHFENIDRHNEVAIDDKNNFYYIKNEKFYVLKSNLSKATFISNVSCEGDPILTQINFHEENVYVASETLSYIHENDTGPLKRVKNTPANITAIAFDNAGNFVLGTKGKIIKYEVNRKDCKSKEGTE